MPEAKQEGRRHAVLTRALNALQSLGMRSDDESWLEMILEEPVADFLAYRVGCSNSVGGSLFQDLKVLGQVVTERRGPQKPLIRVRADVREVTEEDLVALRRRK